MRRIHRNIHVARITAATSLRISSLGLPNIEMELPAPEEINLPAGSQALYVTISAEVLNHDVAREGRGVLRSCMKREYSLVILDMKLVRTADSSGLRWLARLRQTAHWYNVTIQARVSPALALVLNLAGMPMAEFAPQRAPSLPFTGA